MKLPFAPEGMSIVSDDELDERTDDEIVAQLRTYTAPTDSNKNVWAFWDSGFDRMSDWQRRNIISWVRMLASSNWVVRVSDLVPGSENHVSCYVKDEYFPASLYRRKMTGKHAGQHSADLVRLALLHQHGGFWLDVGTILLRHLDALWSLIDEPTSPYEMFALQFPLRPGEEVLINPALAAKRSNEFIRRWHAVYLSLWNDGALECTGFHAHPLLKHLPLYIAPTSTGVIKSDATLSDYTAHMLCAERVRDLIDNSDGFNGRQYYETKICLLPALEEAFLFPSLNSWDGYKEFAVLATRYDDPNHPDFPRAQEIVCRMLQGAFFMKISHGSDNPESLWLADYWNDPKNIGADIAPGTFAEYLRQGALRFRQTRELRVPKMKPLLGKVWKAGLLEPCGDREGV